MLSAYAQSASLGADFAGMLAPCTYDKDQKPVCNKQASSNQLVHVARGALHGTRWETRDSATPVLLKPLGIPRANFLNGLVQHVLGQQLVHDAVYKA